MTVYRSWSPETKGAPGAANERTSPMPRQASRHSAMVNALGRIGSASFCHLATAVTKAARIDVQNPAGVVYDYRARLSLRAVEPWITVHSRPNRRVTP